MAHGSSCDCLLCKIGKKLGLIKKEAASEASMQESSMQESSMQPPSMPEEGHEQPMTGSETVGESSSEDMSRQGM